MRSIAHHRLGAPSVRNVVLGSCCLCLLTATACAQEGGNSIGEAVVAYLTAHEDQRVGGGSAWHMASEALRVAGGEFIPEELGPDAPNPGDRVWGTLVKVISYSGSWTDSAPQAALQPGDVIQFHSATVGTTTYSRQFTAVVAQTDNDGFPISIFVQNRNHVRKVQRSDIDVKALTSGWMRFYRPKARIDRPDEWKFTIVNHRSSPQAFDVLVGIDLHSTNSIDRDNTFGSFEVHWLRTDGTVPNLLHHSGGSFFLETGKGYEIPLAADASGFRQLED